MQRLGRPNGQSKQALACPAPKHGISLHKDTTRQGLLSNPAWGVCVYVHVLLIPARLEPEDTE